MKRFALPLALFAGSLILASCSSVDNQSGSPDTGASFSATKKADKEQSNITPYPFKTCAVQINKPFKGGKPKHRRVYQGQEVLFCCTPCVNAFDMNPDPYMPRIVAAAAAKKQ